MDENAPALIDGKYRVLSKMKEGGMGAIFMVRHVFLDEVRVIKSMRSHLEDDPEAKKRFSREARMATGLRHANIAAVIDFLEDDEKTFHMVMEYIEGGNLSELIHDRGRLTVETALEIGIQTLDALSYLHKRSIVHRDISPENLMLTEDAEGRLLVKLIDLGVAKQVAEQTAMTQTGMFVGKLQYGSPEQLGLLKKGETIDGRTDLYSLGCVLYLALTGEPPFHAETVQGYMSQHLVKGARSFDLTDPNGRVPASLRAVLLKALAKSRDDRYSSADEMRGALRAEKDAFLRRRNEESERLEKEATVAVLAAVHTSVLARRAAALPVAEWDSPTVHVDSVPAGAASAAREARAARRAREEERAEERAESAAAEDRAAQQADAGRRDAPPRPPAPDLRAAASRGTQTPSAVESTRKPSRGRLALVAAAVLGVAVLGAVVAVKSRTGGTKESGTVLLTATPWARVVAVVDEKGKRVASPDLATPARLALPAGRYVMTLRGVAGGRETEAEERVVVRANEEARLHARLPGFDLEGAVRTYVP